MAEAFEAFLKARSLSPKSRTLYDDPRQGASADGKNKRILSLSRNLTERRFEERNQHGPAMANLHFRVLRAVLNYAAEKFSTPDGEPLIPSNPCNRLTALKRWHRIERRTRHLEPHQLRQWFGALTHQPTDTEQRNTVRDFCAFVLLTGCREQEAARLTWKDVNLDAAKVTFQETKNHRTHVLPVGLWLAELLERRQQNRVSQFVFPAENQSGHLLNHRKAILAIGADSGVEFRLHDLRRTFASIASVHLERSLSAYTLKRLLNHSSGGDVTGGYVQVGIEDLREPIRQIEDFVLKCAGLRESAPVVKLAVAPAH